MPVSIISTLLAVVAVGIALRKWHILRDRHLVVSAVRMALQERKPLWAGILAGIFYLTVFLIFGGKGGRVHLLFGRFVWNTTPGEVLTGLALVLLVAISTALFAYGVHVATVPRPRGRSRIGIAGVFLALLACFCP